MSNLIQHILATFRKSGQRRQVGKPLSQKLFDDLITRIPGYPFKTVFDVGAHYGESAQEIRAAFPKANIYSIEPFPESFRILSENVKSLSVRPFMVAFGANAGTVAVQIDREHKRSNRNSLLPANNIHDQSNLVTVHIEVTTLTAFCKQHHIEFIDFLKIDTEGYDLEVLKGSEEMLESSSIFCLQVEVSMNPMNTFHVDFTSVRNYLESYGYLLFGIYNQVQEWKPGRPVLRRCDAVFICLKKIPERPNKTTSIRD